MMLYVLCARHGGNTRTMLEHFNALSAARAWIAAGFSVIPIGFRSKRPAFDALKWAGYMMVDEEGELRPAWEMFKFRAPTSRELELLFAGPRRNLAVVTGYRNLTIIDFDDLEVYGAWQQWAHGEGGVVRGIAASTFRVHTSRGVHVYLVTEEEVESYKLPGIDVKARWGYCLVPPSIHPSGWQYKAEGNQIARVQRLTDILPFEQPKPACIAMSAPASDPWEAASRAVECGGEGVVAAIKASMQAQDLVPIVRQDRGGAWALCPLHGDTNPSLRLYKDGGFKCFGCGAHGDVIDLYAAMHRLTTREAIAVLAALLRQCGRRGRR